RLANRLVGNPEGLAGVELTFGLARLRFLEGAWAALAGAPCPVSGPPGAGMGVPFWVPKGAEVRLGRPEWGLRTYLAVRGGIAVEPVLGSRSTDSLSGLGPPPLRAATPPPGGPTTRPVHSPAHRAPPPDP